LKLASLKMASEFEQVSIEKVKEFWDRRPCNILHSSRPVGLKEYFEEVRARRYFVESHIPQFAQFERWRDKKVLEIGCGIGTDTASFAQHAAAVTAVELSGVSLEVARQWAKIYGLEDRIQFYCGNAEELVSFVPFEPYDLIYSFGVIHHSPHPERIIAQLRYYARAGTTLKIMLYHRYSFKALWILFTYGRGMFWRWKDLIARYSEAQTGCPVTYTYTPAEVSDMLEGNGFRIEEMRVDHIFPYRISDYKNYRYVKVWYFRRMPARWFRWLERHFGWHLCVTARAV